MNTERTSARAGELLEIMRFRLQQQRDGITHTRESVVDATEQLASVLVQSDPAELIWVDVHPSPGIFGRYVRASNGEVLAEIAQHDA